MNLKKFRHENPRNGNFINKSVVRCNFSRSLRERIDETIDGQIVGMNSETINKSAYITIPARARKEGAVEVTSNGI